MKDFYQFSYSLSMDDLMEVWISSFHPVGTVLVIWDAAKYFELLQKCGILVKITEAYNSKVVTVELPGVLEAYELMDSIEEEIHNPIMQVYHDGKLLSDNIEP